MIILDKGSAIPPRVFSSFKQNFLPEEKYFHQKYSGHDMAQSEMSRDGCTLGLKFCISPSLLSSLSHVTAGCAMPWSMVLIFSAVSCF